MVVVSVGGVPLDSGWNIQRSGFPTREAAFQFALGIGRSLTVQKLGRDFTSRGADRVFDRYDRWFCRDMVDR